MSDDLRERFGALDALHFPHADHKTDVPSGLELEMVRGASRGRRLGIAMFALALATLAIVFVVRAFRSPAPERPRPAVDLGGGTIVYSASGPPGWILRTVLPDGTRDASLSAGLPHDAFHPSWSPDGARIVFDAGPTSNKDIYAVNADGSHLRRLTSAGGWDYLPAWSPDGSKIAYVHTAGENNDIWVMDADGSNPVRLTTDPGEDLSPAWSPDSTMIAFASNRAGDNDIYAMNADGSGVSALSASPGFDGAPAWSPDGGEIAFSSTRDGSGIYVMNPDGSGVHKLLDSPGVGSLQSSWSPDGHQLAFTAAPPGGSATATGIYVLNLASVKAQVVVEPANLCCLSWGS
jgi:Tol biopolymer transport system component